MTFTCIEKGCTELVMEGRAKCEAHFQNLHKYESVKVRLEDDRIPMLLWCPECGERHIDEGPFATKPHHTHACQSCGMVWRPAVVATVGVNYLPGYKNE